MLQVILQALQELDLNTEQDSEQQSEQVKRLL